MSACMSVLEREKLDANSASNEHVCFARYSILCLMKRPHIIQSKIQTIRIESCQYVICTENVKLMKSLFGWKVSCCLAIAIIISFLTLFMPQTSTSAISCTTFYALLFSLPFNIVTFMQMVVDLMETRSCEMLSSPKPHALINLMIRIHFVSRKTKRGAGSVER